MKRAVGTPGDKGMPGGPHRHGGAVGVHQGDQWMWQGHQGYEDTPGTRWGRRGPLSPSATLTVKGLLGICAPA